MDTNMLFSIVMFILAAYFLRRNFLNNRKAAANMQEGYKFLQENSTKENVITTESGLQYELIKESEIEDAPSPSADSKVTAHYHGYLMDGSVFDSSVDRGEPISFPLKQVIKGWQEGLQLMKKGDKIRLFVPAHLGYGKRSIRTIPAGSLLIFEIELIDIQ